MRLLILFLAILTIIQLPDPMGLRAFIGDVDKKGPLGPWVENCHGERLYVWGADVNCSDFCDCQEAERFFKLAGGPKRDPHQLDPDRDRQPCNQLCNK